MSRGLLQRCCGTLEILACVEAVQLDHRYIQLVPLEDRMEELPPLQQIARNPSKAEPLFESIAFIPEALYNRLKDEAEEFLDTMEGGDSSIESLVRKHSRSGGVLTEEGGE